MKQKEKFIIGKKVGMTQIFDEAGNLIPVTVVQAGPCTIVQKKTIEKEGYTALQIGFDEVAEKKLNKPQKGHLAKHKSEKLFKVLKEIRVEDIDKYNEGDVITTDIFAENDTIQVSGRSIGKGFAGTVKRWNFTIGPKAHGSKNHRIPGSIGGGTGQARVFKGKKMGGHMGNRNVHIKNATIHKIIADDNLILIKGGVPGKKDNIVVITD